MKDMNHDIYISYTSKDTELANIINRSIRKAGIETFIFDSLTATANAGLSYEEVVINAINTSKLVLFLCTGNSIQSNWVKNEVMHAYKLGKSIIPVMVDGTELPIDLYPLTRYKHLKISTVQLERDIKHLIVSLIDFIQAARVADSPEETTQITATPSIDQVNKVENYTASQTEATETPQKIILKKILSVVLYTIIGIIGLFYLFGISLAFDSGNIGEGISFLAPILAAAILLIWHIYSARKYELKLHCSTEDDIESTLTVTVDDHVVTSFIGNGMVRLRERKSDCLICIDSKNPEIISERFTYRFCKENHGEIKQVTLKKKPSAKPEQLTQTPSNITPFQCFIAGSTRLVDERNATRAVLSILYNKWENYNLVISSYTFEDFSNSYTIGGQQIQYNDFIKDKADCAIFIVTENVGDKTLEEYRLAVETFKSNRKRPKIFVYANNLSDSELTKQFIDEVHKNNSYWRDYRDIKDLMNLVKDDVDSELFNIFVLNQGYNASK